ncbi:hypothetical protein EVAR_97061_1 [Eumeta japonica]|uniref:Uncharacterized protein n=1 Tax=Eumeta variegata TaxID=151549 RepID=A0A4C2A6B9_EUMVA|nr:hypothetical protein EVAR_97061_1 [Eumeta japonica]
MAICKHKHFAPLKDKDQHHVNISKIGRSHAKSRTKTKPEKVGDHPNDIELLQCRAQSMPGSSYGLPPFRADPLEAASSTQGHTEIKRGKYLIESYLDQEEKPVYFGKLPHPVYLLKLGSRVSKKWTSRHWTVLP